MKSVRTFLAIVSVLILGCGSSDLRQAEQLYRQSQRAHLQVGDELSDPLGEAIGILEAYLSRHHDEPRATLLLWRCYLRAAHPRAQAMYENMKGMPEVMRRILPSAIRKEKDELMRERMVNLFGDIATEHEVAPLIHILEIDENTKVQQAAAEVLARLGDAAAAPPLLKKLSSAQPTERFYASRVLSSFPRPEVAAALFSHLENPQETPEVRHQAAQSLAAIIRMGFNDDDTFVQQLEQLLQDQAQPLSTKLLAALTLAALGHHSGYDLAMTNARSADTYLRGLAIIILGYIGDKEALPFLTDALQYGNKALRLQAAEALGRLGDAKALPSLYKALDDPSDAVREAAQKSINTIKAKGANG